MPKPFNVAALLDRIIDANAVSQEDIEALVTAAPVEGLHHDFKSGQLLDRGDAAFEVRCHVSAFANSEGGLLVLGVAEGAPRTFDRASDNVRGQRLRDWAQSAMSPIAAQFTEQPRYFEAQIGERFALVIAVQRNGNLVSVVKDGRQQWWLRHGGETILAPDYLVADLMLGRRRSPRLQVDIPLAPVGNTRHNSAPPRHEPWFRVIVRVANDSPVWIDDVRIGVITYTLRGVESAPLTHQLGPHVRSLVDAVDPPGSAFTLTHMMATSAPGVQPIEPFQTLIAPLSGRIELPSEIRRYDFRAALYVAGRGMDPLWFQLGGEIDTSEIIQSQTQLVTANRVARGQLPEVRFQKSAR